jgi:hypothetical protein
MNARAAERKLLLSAAEVINKNLITEWVAQGHHLTGSWERSLHGSVIGIGDAVILQGTMNSYGGILEQGVKSNRIPYGGHSASGGTSKYIQGLVSYFKLRGLAEKEAIRAAFATAKTHKKEGMPTSGSYAYSKTGARTKFIRVVEKAIGPAVDKMILDGFDQIVDAKYREVKSETI